MVLVWEFPLCFVPVRFFPIRNIPAWYVHIHGILSMFITSPYVRPWSVGSVSSLKRHAATESMFAFSLNLSIEQCLFPDFSLSNTHDFYQLMNELGVCPDLAHSRWSVKVFAILYPNPGCHQSHSTELYHPSPKRTQPWISSITHNMTAWTHGWVWCLP